MKPNLAYVIGFIQADGHLSTKKVSEDGKLIGKGELTIDLSIRDKDILPKIGKVLTNNFYISERTRDTNFKKNYKSAKLSINNLEIRQKLFDYGVPCGKKSGIVFPSVDLKYDCNYWRGFIDGDGSLGITSAGIPFISLITNSYKLAAAYVDFLQKLTGKIKTFTLNKRDGCYNIAIWKEDAVIVAKNLYSKKRLSLDRKKNAAKDIINWKRPKNMKVRDQIKSWSDNEEKVLLSNNNDQQVANILKRTVSSVKNRRYRLNKIDK